MDSAHQKLEAARPEPLLPFTGVVPQPGASANTATTAAIEPVEARSVAQWSAAPSPPPLPLSHSTAVFEAPQSSPLMIIKGNPRRKSLLVHTRLPSLSFYNFHRASYSQIPANSAAAPSPPPPERQGSTASFTRPNTLRSHRVVTPPVVSFDETMYYIKQLCRTSTGAPKAPDGSGGDSDKKFRVAAVVSQVYNRLRQKHLLDTSHISVVEGECVVIRWWSKNIQFYEVHSDFKTKVANGRHSSEADVSLKELTAEEESEWVHVGPDGEVVDAENNSNDKQSAIEPQPQEGEQVVTTSSGGLVVQVHNNSSDDEDDVMEPCPGTAKTACPRGELEADVDRFEQDDKADEQSFEMERKKVDEGDLILENLSSQLGLLCRHQAATQRRSPKQGPMEEQKEQSAAVTRSGSPSRLHGQISVSLGRHHVRSHPHSMLRGGCLYALWDDCASQCWAITVTSLQTTLGSQRETLVLPCVPNEREQQRQQQQQQQQQLSEMHGESFRDFLQMLLGCTPWRTLAPNQSFHRSLSR